MIEFSYNKETNITTAIYTGMVDIKQTLEIPDKTDAVAGDQKVVRLLADQSRVNVNYGGDNLFVIELNKAIRKGREWTKDHDYIKIAAVPGNERNTFYAKTFKILAKYVPNFYFEYFDTCEEAEELLLD